MKLKDIISVTGLPGLYRVAGNRPNGMIVEELSSGKKRFASARKHQFTPLESIGIYVQNGETVEIRKVFTKMLEQRADNPPPAASASGSELREYFLDVLPDHDEDRVKSNDIKKMVKWFGFLDQKGYLTAEEEEDTPAEEAADEAK